MTRSIAIPHWLAWQGLGLLFLAIWPSYRWFGQPVWAVTTDQRAQILVHVAGFVLAVVAALIGGRGTGPRLPGTFAAAVGGLAASCLAILLVPLRAYEPGLLVFASGTVIACMVLPLLLVRAARPGVARALLAIATLAAVAAVLSIARPGSASRTVSEVYYGTPQPLRITRYLGHAGSGRADGGALVSRGDDLFLVDGDGRFFRLSWPNGGDALSVRRLPLRAPLNLDEFDADVPGSVSRRRFRVTGAAVERGTAGDRIVVSHHHWKTETGCVTLRLSTIELPGSLDDGDLVDPGDRAWSTIHDALPCLPLAERDGAAAFYGQNMGGRVVRLGPNRFLWTVGNASEQLLSQDPASDFGKTIEVDLRTGRVSHFSVGHRNPQGLHVDDRGTIWLTEHGPRGGDELNRLERGGNYGWPYETYGLEYRSLSEPPFSAPDDSVAYVAPVHAWVPSIGVSNLIVVRDTLFRHWRGDLLVSSLRAERLFRIRLADGRAAYAEPIEVGERVRDIAEGRDGRIVLWTDTRSIISLRPADPAADPTVLLAPCFECHPARTSEPGAAPDLRGVFGRRIASLPGYDYSEALRAWGDRWTGNRLHRFLADPAGAVPGTLMDSPGVADSARRAALIDALARFR